MIEISVRAGCISLCLAGLLLAQTPQTQGPLPPGFGPPALRPRGSEQADQPPQTPPPAKPSPAKPAPAKPAQPQTQPGAQPAQPPAAEGGRPVGPLSLQNASLTQVVDMLARSLHMNYILDPRVKGGVILNTYGETKNIDERSLLETILRINGAGMVKTGDIWRIVPLADIQHLPLAPQMKTSAAEIADDDETMLNLVFLKFVTVDELSKVLEPFIGEGSRMIAYPPANLLFLLDSRRSIRRTMELISIFDSDILANQRVRLFDIKNSRPSDVAQELDKILSAVAMNQKGTSTVKFLPGGPDQHAHRCRA